MTLMKSVLLILAFLQLACVTRSAEEIKTSRLTFDKVDKIVFDVWTEIDAKQAFGSPDEILESNDGKDIIWTYFDKSNTFQRLILILPKQTGKVREATFNPYETEAESSLEGAKLRFSETKFVTIPTPWLPHHHSGPSEVRHVSKDGRVTLITGLSRLRANDIYRIHLNAPESSKDRSPSKNH